MLYCYTFGGYDFTHGFLGVQEGKSPDHAPLGGVADERSCMQKVKETFKALSTMDKVKLVAGWLRDRKAIDVQAIDVRGLSPITEALVVATATSVRHAQGLANAILDQVAEENLEYLGMEGFQQGAWILVDLNDVLVHIFQADNRKFYNIEGLWSEGEPIELPFHDE